MSQACVRCGHPIAAHFRGSCPKELKTYIGPNGETFPRIDEVKIVPVAQYRYIQGHIEQEWCVRFGRASRKDPDDTVTTMAPHIGKIEVHTATTDAAGIARDIGPVLVSMETTHADLLTAIELYADLRFRLGAGLWTADEQIALAKEADDVRATIIAALRAL